MKAIERYYSGVTFPPTLHSDVVEITQKGTRHREFKCQKCGRSWIENINSPQIIESDVEANLRDYYPDYVECTPIE